MKFLMANKFGIMQGRLLPKLNNRDQANPLGYWQDEFILAKKLKLDLIEFIFDYDNYKLNPLVSLSGEGNVNFDLFFDELKKLNYNGPIIFQSYRDDEGVKIFKKQFELFNKFKY